MTVEQITLKSSDLEQQIVICFLCVCGCIWQHVGSQFPHQGMEPVPSGVQTPTLCYGTAREGLISQLLGVRNLQIFLGPLVLGPVVLSGFKQGRPSSWCMGCFDSIHLVLLCFGQRLPLPSGPSPGQLTARP